MTTPADPYKVISDKISNAMLGIGPTDPYDAVKTAQLLNVLVLAITGVTGNYIGNTGDDIETVLGTTNELGKFIAPTTGTTPFGKVRRRSNPKKSRK